MLGSFTVYLIKSKNVILVCLQKKKKLKIIVYFQVEKNLVITLAIVLRNRHYSLPYAASILHFSVLERGKGNPSISNLIFEVCINFLLPRHRPEITWITIFDEIYENHTINFQKVYNVKDKMPKLRLLLVYDTVCQLYAKIFNW